eukprot:NODE_623_length_5907_cov_0.380165.p2 type:complete len:165 gc:universal NODE_623_length_5907_cov_0.380165:3439-2945(-)
MQYARRLSQNFTRRPSKIGASPDRDLFFRIIHDPKGKKLFLSWIQRENKMEMFYFYENIMTFKRTLKQLEEEKVTVSPDKLKQAASRIIESYIRDGASMYIAVDITCKIEIMDKYNSGDIHSDLFEDVLEDHINKLGQIIGKEFMTSEEGQKYVDIQFCDFESF